MTRPPRAARCAAALAFAAAFAPALGAQQVPANLPSAAAQAVASRPVTPFRKGQWGMEFAFVQNAPHVGFLKFRSPTKAWVLDVGVNGFMADDEAERPDTVFTQKRNGINTSVLLGIRSYRALTPRAVRTIQFGLTGTHAYSENERESLMELNATTIGAGAQLDLGGAYHFTPGFSLGGTIALGGRWSTREVNYADGRRDAGNAIDFGLDGSRLVASLFF